MAKDLHVVMLPWSAFGHMMPFFHLAMALSKAGVRVSFVSTPKNIQRLPQTPPDLAALINFVELPLPVVDDGVLPEGAEATIDIGFEKIAHLKAAYDLLEEEFRKFIADRLPNWIIVDVMSHWAAEIAEENGIRLLFFTVFSAATMAFLGPPEYLVGDGQKRLRSSSESLMSPPEWISFPSSVAFRKHEAIDNFGALYRPNGTEKTDAQRIAKILQACQAMAIRTCREYEGDYVSLLEKLLGKPVIPVGLLPPEPPKGKEIIDPSWVKVFQWLDERNPKSVVFLGFGSECKLSKEQVYEIAYGLELSELPFLWALRKPNWAADDSDALPPGFSKRIHGRGLVSTGSWAPQMGILAHPSVGGSLFHSGWGSIIEALQFGHRLVVLPLIIDQPLNARMLVEKGLAVEIERKEDGSFCRDDIAKSLKLAMVSEEGEGLRARAREAARVFGDQKLHQDYYIGRFVEYLSQ